VLRAAGDLRLHWRADGSGSVGFGPDAEDWLGPVSAGWLEGDSRRRLDPTAVEPFEGRDELGEYRGVELRWGDLSAPLGTTVRAYRERSLLVFRTQAREAVEGLASGSFPEPRLAWPWFHPTARRSGGIPAGARSYGHQYSEFAFPVFGDADCRGYVFVPHRPPVVLPLAFVTPEGPTLLLAPLDAFHEQVVAVPRDPSLDSQGVRCGWHGDLERVPAGFASEIGVWAAQGLRAALTGWGSFLRERHGTTRRGRYGDELMGRLSYWTDNGAVYYYRTARGLDYAGTLARAVEDLEQRQVPVRAVHIDSWFYPHQNLRVVSDQGAPVVPPSGMLAWEPRADVFPEGLEGLSARLGGRPLSLHSRHFSARSPYWEDHPAWLDGDQAHPADPGFFESFLERAAHWGAVTVEQDWMVESFLGVRGLREEPGRVRAWQQGLDAAAERRGLTLLWCMATPADFMETVRLRSLNAVRTSGDYQYLYDNALNWVWFLHGNALARALGLWPYKDVFLSHDATGEGHGEPLAEAEALLAALSGGPVGIGDQIGHVRREVVMRTCREDGVLVKPDLPLAVVDRCFTAHPYFSGGPLVAETWSRHPAGDWIYVVAMNASHESKVSGEPLSFRVELADLGESRPRAAVLAYDWRRQAFAHLEPDDGWGDSLSYQDWSLHVLCPLLAGDATVFGDPVRYATVGDRRLRGITAEAGALRFDVQGAPGTTAQIHGFAATRPHGAEQWSVDGSRSELVLEWSGNGRWVARVPLRRTGTVRVRVRLG
jgi:hypothetical protein